jgi:dihydrofolate synthase/folylpolyglutamate synthase
MEFSKAVEYLYSLIDYERKKGYVESLDPFFEFLGTFGNPHLKLRNPILIVGTKGKGSTAHLIAGGLLSQGFKVGLYTSPHLVDIRERIKINGEKISETKFANFIEQIKPFIEGKRGIRTVFETLTLMAFLYFLEENVDYTVLEAGLGGRLDATNSANQILTVITNISYDHMEILGERITQIAREKAAVIKNANPVIVASQHPQVHKTIRNVSEKFCAPLYPLNKYVRYHLAEATLEKTVIKYRGLSEEKILTLNQGGSFQARNMALSALALEVLGFRSFDFNRVKIEGRFEILSKKPLIIVDGAHNVASIKNFIASVHKLIGMDCTFVFGINSDKEVEKIVQEIVKSNPAFVILTRSKSPRAMTPEGLAKIFTEKGFTRFSTAENSDAALRIALSRVDRILVFGSFYLAGEIKELFQKQIL